MSTPSWEWKKRRFERYGFCKHCSQNRAGQEIDGRKGTTVLCGSCAEKHRIRNKAGWVPTGRRGRPPGKQEKKRYVRYARQERAAKVDELLELSRVAAKSSVTPSDIRRHALC